MASCLCSSVHCTCVLASPHPRPHLHSAWRTCALLTCRRRAGTCQSHLLPATCTSALCVPFACCVSACVPRGMPRLTLTLAPRLYTALCSRSLPLCSELRACPTRSATRAAPCRKRLARLVNTPPDPTRPAPAHSPPYRPKPLATGHFALGLGHWAPGTGHARRSYKILQALEQAHH